MRAYELRGVFHRRHCRRLDSRGWSPPCRLAALAGQGKGPCRTKDSAEKLRAEADNAEQIARSATAVQKRELYERLAVHFRQLAAEIEKVMADRAE